MQAARVVTGSALLSAAMAGRRESPRAIKAAPTLLMAISSKMIRAMNDAK